MQLTKLQTAISLLVEGFSEMLNENVAQPLKETVPMKAESERNELLNFKEMCQLLGISATSGHKYKRLGYLKVHRLGGKIFFKKDEVLESLKVFKSGRQYEQH